MTVKDKAVSENVNNLKWKVKKNPSVDCRGWKISWKKFPYKKIEKRKSFFFETTWLKLKKKIEVPAEEIPQVAVTMTDNKRKGKFPEFIPGTNVSSYLQTVDIFFALNKTPENEKSLEFITCVGQETSSKIISSFKPEQAITKTFAQIKERFKVLNNEERNVFAERYKLVTRRQKEGESLDDFAIELQNTVEHCDVTNDTEATLVQTIFVAGLKSEKTREVLLREGDKTMSLAILLTKAKTMETAERESFNMKSSTSSEINYVANQKGASGQWRNSNRNMIKQNRFDSDWNPNHHRGYKRSVPSSIVCYNCYQPGHMSPECPNPKIKKPRSNYNRPINQRERRRTFDQRINQLSNAMEELKIEFYDDEENPEDDCSDEHQQCTFR